MAGDMCMHHIFNMQFIEKHGSQDLNINENTKNETIKSILTPCHFALQLLCLICSTDIREKLSQFITCDTTSHPLIRKIVSHTCLEQHVETCVTFTSTNKNH